MASRSDGITRLYEVPQVPESERLPQPPKTKDKVLLDERGLLDLPFLALTVLLVLIGVVMVFSASYARAYYLKGNSTYYFARQAIFAVAGIGGMLFVSRLNYQLWRSASFIIIGCYLVFMMLFTYRSSARRPTVRSAGSRLRVSASSLRNLQKSPLS